MSNEHWNPHTPQEVDPWDRDTYTTGSTQPPKSRLALLAALLALCIFLCGLMTLLNIRLFQQSNQPPVDSQSPMNIYDPDASSSEEPRNHMNPTRDPGLTEPPENPQTQIDLSASPAGLENKPQADGLSLQQIYTNTIHSVVSITCSLPHGTSSGTGLVISADGYIVTNAHVVEGASMIQVILTDGRVLSAVVVGADEVSDLAVLWVECTGLFPAQLGDSSALRVGDAVVAIGDPLGVALRGTMTDGIVSGINRDITVNGRTMTLIQTTAALNEGNSGGPLINCYGQVIGINTMKIGDSMSAAGVEGLGFAIPSATVAEIAQQLIGQGYVSGRPDIGFDGQTVSVLYQLYGYLPRGLYITEIDRDSDAYQKGIREGDVLISLDGVRITSPDELDTQVYTYAVGDKAIAVIHRDGRDYEVELTVGEAGSR